MKYFVVNCQSDKSAAVIERFPEGGPEDWRYDEGEPLTKVFPAGATMKFSRNFPKQRQLRDFIYNPLSALIISPKVRDILTSVKTVKAEYLPVNIVDHAGKVVGKDYSILNPLGGVEIIDMKKSEYTMGSLDKTQILSIDKLVVDDAAVGKSDVFFRASKRRRVFIMREDLKTRFEEAGLTGWGSWPCDDWDGFYI